jgi:hypothetical protein
MLRKQFSNALPVMEAARDFLLAFTAFPAGALAQYLEHRTA